MATLIYSLPNGTYYARTAGGFWTPVAASLVERGLDRGIYTLRPATQEVLNQIQGSRNQQAVNVGPAGNPLAGNLPLFPPEPGSGDTQAYSSTAAGMAADNAAQETRMRLQAEIDAAAAAGDFERQKYLLEIQQKFEREQEDRRREDDRLARQEQLKQERLKTYTDLLGNDPVRAVLYALGVGGETTGLPQEQFAGMEPLAGAQQKKTETELGLNTIANKYLGASAAGYGQTTPGVRPTSVDALKLLRAGDKEGANRLLRQSSGLDAVPGTTAGISLNNEGVQGLGSVQNISRAFIQGDEGTRKLLGSAYGVGNKATGGKSIEELMRLSEEVKPKGVLRY